MSATSSSGDEVVTGFYDNPSRDSYAVLNACKARDKGDTTFPHRRLPRARAHGAPYRRPVTLVTLVTRRPEAVDAQPWQGRPPPRFYSQSQGGGPTGVSSRFFAGFFARRFRTALRIS
jgi:hypothetical protein